MANLKVDNLSGSGGRNAIDGSVFFDGNNSHLKVITSSDLALGTADFTIETWVNFSKIDTYQSIIDFRESNGNFPFLVRDTDGDLYWHINGSTIIDNIPARANNCWHHVAVVRNSGTTKIYLNGVEKGSASDSTDYVATNDPYIGGSTANSNDFFGYLSNLRITKSALYTSNFTPSTEKLTILDDTVLLCCQDSENPTQEATGKEVIGFGCCYYGKRYSNLVTNGNLEDGTTTGWTNGGMDTFEVSNFSHSGSYSLHCVSNSNGDAVAYTLPTLNTKYRYKISAYINCVGPDGTSAKAKMKIGDGISGNENYESQTVGYDSLHHFNKWGYVEWIGLATSDTTTVSFVESSSNAVNDFYVDDLRVELWYPEETENILANPDFLTGATGWTFISNPVGEYSISSNRLNHADNRTGGDAFAQQQLFASSVKEGKYRVTVDYVLSAGGFDVGIGNNRIWSISGSGSSTWEIDAGDTNSNFRLICNHLCTGYFNSIHLYRIAEPKRNNPVPSVGVDEGVTFEGDTKINSKNYMYFPTGDTSQRGRGRGIFGGGYKSPWGTADNLNSIEYFNIQSTGNAIDFGDRAVIPSQGMATVASSTRGVMMGGRGYKWPAAPTNTVTDTIDYVTIAQTGNAIDFGNLTHGANYIFAAASNATRGVVFRSGDGDMEYITIASTGDSIDTGSDSTVGRNSFSGFASQTRAFWSGGANPSGGAAIGSIDYLEIASLGVPQDFGDLNFTGHNQAATSNTRGIIFTGGFPSAASNAIDFITMASVGDALDFGDLIANISSHGGGSGCSNGIRAVRCAGSVSPASSNRIDYVTIATTGNALDFGDLSTIRQMGSGFSDSHGGI